MECSIGGTYSFQTSPQAGADAGSDDFPSCSYVSLSFLYILKHNLGLCSHIIWGRLVAKSSMNYSNKYKVLYVLCFYS